MRGGQAAELLSRTTLFRDLSREALRELADATSERGYRKGQPVFSEGDPGESLYLTVVGRIKVYVTSDDGDEMVLATLQPPDLFGEIALIDGRPRSASAEALEGSTLLELGRQPFLELVAKHPSMRESLLLSLGGVLRRLTEQASDLVFLDLHGRVAKLLVGMADAHGPSEDGTLELDLELTQSDLASMVGGSRQSVNQILRSFDRRGYIDVHGRKVAIKSLANLRRRAGM